MKTSLWLSAALHPVLRRKAEQEASAYPLRLVAGAANFRERVAGKDTAAKLIAKFPDKEDIIKQLAEDDPTPNSNWLMPMWNWFLKNPLWDHVHKIGYVAKLLYLADLEKVKDSWPKSSRPTPADWRTHQDCLDWLVGVNPPKRLLKENADFDVIYEDETWKIFQINNKEAACIIGADTDWCFTKWNQTYYETRLELGTPYIARNKKDAARTISFRILEEIVVYDNDTTTVFKDNLSAKESIEWAQLKWILATKLKLANGTSESERTIEELSEDLENLLGPQPDAVIAAWNMIGLDTELIAQYIQMGLTNPVEVEVLHNSLRDVSLDRAKIIGPLEAKELAVAQQAVKQYKAGVPLEDAFGYDLLQMTEEQKALAKSLGLYPDSLIDWHIFIQKTPGAPVAPVGEHLGEIQKWMKIEPQVDQLYSYGLYAFSADELGQAVKDFKLNLKELYDTGLFNNLMRLLIRPKEFVEQSYSNIDVDSLIKNVLEPVKASGFSGPQAELLRDIVRTPSLSKFFDSPGQFNAVAAGIGARLPDLLNLDSDTLNIRPLQDQIRLILDAMKVTGSDQDTDAMRGQAAVDYLLEANRIAAQEFSGKNAREKSYRSMVMRDLAKLISGGPISPGLAFSVPVDTLVEYAKTLNFRVKPDTTTNLPFVDFCITLAKNHFDSTGIAEGYLLGAKNVEEVHIANNLFKKLDEDTPAKNPINKRGLLKHLIRNHIDLTAAEKELAASGPDPARRLPKVYARLSGFSPEGFEQSKSALPDDLGHLWVIGLLLHVPANKFKDLKVDELKRLIFRNKKGVDLPLMVSVAKSCLELTGGHAASAATLAMVVRNFYGDFDEKMNQNPLAGYTYALKSSPIPWSEVSIRYANYRSDSRLDSYLMDETSYDMKKALHLFLDFLRSGLTPEEYMNLNQPDQPTAEPPTSSVRIGGLDVLASYQGGHKPSNIGPPAHAILSSEVVPPDTLSHPHYYTGFKGYLREFLPKLKQLQGKPDTTITIYRALPEGRESLNHGDWVTPSFSYAKTHLESQYGDDSGQIGHIIQAEVPAHTLRWAVDDLMEWGYFGPVVEGRPVSQKRQARLVQKSKDGKKQWALVSTKDPGKVLKWFGARKPSEEAVEKEEKRVQYFKHKG